jgi:hypothetical protein
MTYISETGTEFVNTMHHVYIDSRGEEWRRPTKYNTRTLVYAFTRSGYKNNTSL